MSSSDTANAIPVQILWPHDFDRQGQWAVGGVPMQRGELQPQDVVALRGCDGTNLPLQTRILAYWPDGSVKWLLLITRTDIKASQNAHLQLVKHCEPARPSPAIKVEETQNGIQVDTGPMVFTVPRGCAGLLSSVKLDGREMLQPEQTPELFIRVRRRGEGCCDEERLYRSYGTEQGFAAQVEEQGPCRAIIKLTGTHVAEDGSTFAPYTVRLYAYAGEAAIHIAHTFIYDGEPQRDMISALGVRLPIAIDSPREYRYGGNIKPATHSYANRCDEWQMVWRQGELYQDSSTHYRFDKRIYPNKPPVKIEEGQRCDGWVDLSDDEVGLQVVIRHMWQNYPKSLMMDYEDRSVTAYLWPSRHQPLDLQWYSDVAYGLCYECPGCSEQSGLPRLPTANAHGISKTHELLLHFHRQETDEESLRRCALAFDDRPVLCALPERYAETRVLGRLRHHDPDLFPAAEERFVEQAEYILQEQSLRGWYGMIDYGDIVHSYNPDIHQWTSDEGGYGWLNTEFQPDQWLWYTFVRTGRYDFFRLAEAMARHTTDIDMLHTGPWKGFGCRHGVQHWSDGDREIRISMPGGRRLHYLLTGDERTRDAIELAVSHYQTMNGRIDTRATLSAALFGYFVAWEITGADKYRSMVENITDIFCDLHPAGAPYEMCEVDLSTGRGQALHDSGVIYGGMFKVFGGLQVLLELAELEVIPALDDMLLSYADYCLLPPERRSQLEKWEATAGQYHQFTTLRLNSFAYLKTGEAKYLQAVEETFVEPGVEFAPAPWDESVKLLARSVAGQQMSARERPSWWRHRIALNAIMAAYGIQMGYGLQALFTNKG